ncbi:MAG: hypothetical protein JRN35_06040 [Nitrososphaerota archaeon]|nr:hypothetical protein [Nitrososphaerota archaeon]
MGILRVKRKAYKRKGYTRRAYTRADGTRVKAAHVGPSSVPMGTFTVSDRGKPGRTPKSQRFYHPKVKTGWHKDSPLACRRAKVLRAHKGDNLSAARAMQALANVTTDRMTKEEAQLDANYFYNRYSRPRR